METAVTQPVVATATTEADRAPAPQQKQQAKRTPIGTDNQIDSVLSELFTKHGGSEAEYKSLSEITDSVTQGESDDVQDPKPKPELKAAPEPKKAPPPAKPETEPEPKQPDGKVKVKVGDQEFELSSDQLQRFAQKGIYYEKKGTEIAKFDQELQAREQKVAKQEEREQAFLNALDKDPGQVLEYLFGDNAFEKIKPWATQKVQKIQEYEQNPQQQAIDAANARAEKAERELNTRNQTQKEAQEQEEVNTHLQNYQKTIKETLSLAGLPAGDDVTFLAAEAAGHMRRAMARGIEYTPQQLAEILKQDNTVRVRTTLGSAASKVEECKKANDLEGVVKWGGIIAEQLGDSVVYALAKYHLAKLQKGQPNQPKQILETPRTQQTKDGIRPGALGKNGRQYMSEDDYADMRKKIARGEIEPPAGW